MPLRYAVVESCLPSQLRVECELTAPNSTSHTDPVFAWSMTLSAVGVGVGVGTGVGDGVGVGVGTGVGVGVGVGDGTGVGLGVPVELVAPPPQPATNIVINNSNANAICVCNLAGKVSSWFDIDSPIALPEFSPNMEVFSNLCHGIASQFGNFVFITTF